MNTRKLILYIAASLDGYISMPNDDLSFLDMVHQEGEDYGYSNFIKDVDTVILGRRTYDWVMNQVAEFPHADKETYVMTRNERPNQENINFYTGDLKNLVSTLKGREGKKIFCDGGAEIVNELLREKLFDELIISVIPVLLGNGIKLFQDGRPEENLELISARSFDSGLVQLHYKMIPNFEGNIK